MSALIPVSPLMALVHYQGRDYYPSQYFHAEYSTKHPGGTRLAAVGRATG